MYILESAAKNAGVDIFIEPSRQKFAVLLFKNERKFYFKSVNFNINSSASRSLTKNKAAASYFLSHFGYNIPEFTMIYRESRCKREQIDENIEHGLEFAKQIGFPVILKPNDLSRGRFVFKPYDEEEYSVLASIILKNNYSAQVQRYYAGNEYRIVVLGQKVLLAYQRIPFNITGDGESSISDLIDKKQLIFISTGRTEKLSKDDNKLKRRLTHLGLTIQDIPNKGEKIVLQDITKVSSGGETLDLTNMIHDTYRSLALGIARDMNLVLCGIDIICNDLTQRNDGKYVIIEVNSAPGLDNSVFAGDKQRNYVESLYTEVFLYIKSQYV